MEEKMAKKKSKASKSDHKHIYVEILVSLQAVRFMTTPEVYSRTFRVQICSICGKVNNYWIAEKYKESEFSHYRAATREELIQMYPDMIIMDFANEPAKIYHFKDVLKSLDFKGKYLSLIQASLKDPDASVSDELLEYGLTNSIKPDDMADLILHSNSKKN